MSIGLKIGTLASLAFAAFVTLAARPAEAGPFDPLPVYAAPYYAYSAPYYGSYYAPAVVAYRRPLLRPFAPRVVVGYAPAVGYAPTVVGYAPAYAPTVTSYAPTVTSYAPAYSPTVVNYAPTYAPTVTSYAPSYAPTVTSYAPAYGAPTVVNYPGVTTYYRGSFAAPVPAVAYPAPTVVYPPSVFP